MEKQQDRTEPKRLMFWCFGEGKWTQWLSPWLDNGPAAADPASAEFKHIGYDGPSFILGPEDAGFYDCTVYVWPRISQSNITLPEFIIEMMMMDMRMLVVVQTLPDLLGLMEKLVPIVDCSRRSSERAALDIHLSDHGRWKTDRHGQRRRPKWDPDCPHCRAERPMMEQVDWEWEQ